MDTIITNLHAHPSRGNRTSINVSLSVHSFNIAPPKISIPTVASAVASVPPARYAAMSPRDQGSDENAEFFHSQNRRCFGGPTRWAPSLCRYKWSEMGSPPPGPINCPKIDISNWDLGWLVVWDFCTINSMPISCQRFPLKKYILFSALSTLFGHFTHRLHPPCVAWDRRLHHFPFVGSLGGYMTEDPTVVRHNLKTGSRRIPQLTESRSFSQQAKKKNI